NEKIPVYKIIDPIDKIFPSFLLLLILIFLFLIILFFAVVPLLFGPSVATIHAVDNEGDNVVGVSVDLIFEDGSTKTLRTDAFGRFSFNLIGSEVTIGIDDEDYESFNETVNVSTAEETEIVLTKIDGSGDLLQKVIVINNKETQSPLIGAQISFTCSNNKSVTPSTIYNSKSEETILVNKECGILTGSVRLSGFTDETRTLTGARTIFQMMPVNTASFDAKVRVFVTSEEGIPLPGISVTIYNENGFIDRKQTDASGTHIFEVNPGVYYAKVSDNGFPPQYIDGESEEITIESGDDETLTLALVRAENDADIGKILVKFVDKATGSPIENVSAVFFENGDNKELDISGSDGLVDLPNADFNKSYSVSAVHEDYIFKVAVDLEVISLNASVPTKVELVKAEPPAQFSNIEVHVKSLEGNPIADASVHLSEVGLDYSIRSGATDSDGKAIFSNMPVGRYKAFAESAGQEGKTEFVQSSSGATLVLEIILVLQTAKMEVTVVDIEGNPVSGATVKFIDAVEGNLAEEITNEKGIIEQQEFKWNLKPYLKISKEGFLITNTDPFDLAPRSTIKTTIILHKVSHLETLNCIEEQALCIGLGFNGIVENTASRKVATKFESNKSYVLLFDIYAGEALDGVTAVVRTGLESTLTAETSNFVIKKSSGSLGASAIKYSSFNPANNYEGVTVTDADGKQVILTFGDLEPGLYNFEVEVFVKANLPVDTKIEARYGVKATSGESTLYILSETALVPLQWTLNEL
ncbi:MAG: carboxypeptidase-like regulatory domain-containing protein, partial [archaeon]|nr:carboxypeptidase-like regulatory domain-containing protein [archaeon]